MSRKYILLIGVGIYFATVNWVRASNWIPFASPPKEEKNTIHIAIDQIYYLAFMAIEEDNDSNYREASKLYEQVVSRIQQFLHEGIFWECSDEIKELMRIFNENINLLAMGGLYGSKRSGVNQSRVDKKRMTMANGDKQATYKLLQNISTQII